MLTRGAGGGGGGTESPTGAVGEGHHRVAALVCWVFTNGSHGHASWDGNKSKVEENRCKFHD